jgi:hypothetical protein
MVQQWFLDLDGVRSGPYQTPEVLGLVAEGEVLPHHRISTSLKDQPWITILEWRLEQAKQPPSNEKKSYVPEGRATGAPPADKPYDLRWNEPKEASSTPPASRLAREVGAVDLNPEAGEDEIEEVIQVLGAPTIEIEIPAEPVASPPPAPPAPAEPDHKPSNIVLEPVHKVEPPAAPVHSPPAAPAAAASDGEAPARAKRDPMAEMFDILQNTRQKREAKEKAAHHERSQHPTPAQERETRLHPAPPAAAANSSWVKSVVIGLLITVAGFLLGQLFQHSAETPATSASTTEKNLTAPARPAEPQTEVIDRSTDKLTIRARVERQPEAPAAPPVAIPRNKALPQGMASPAINPKEMQELRDLKKELQELKALKEELRNAPAAIDDGSNIPMDENYLTAPDENGIGGAEYSPNDAPMQPGSGGFHTPPPRDLNQPAVNY